MPFLIILFTILIVILKIVVLVGLLSFISFCLMAIGLIPSEKFCEILREHEKIQITYGVFMAIGLLGAFVLAL